MTAYRVAGTVFWTVTGLLPACSASLAGSQPLDGPADVSQSSDIHIDIGAPTTTSWSADFAEVESLAGWTMGDCDGSKWPAWRVQHDMIWLGRACRLDEHAGPEMRLGTALYPPDVTFRGGWLVMEAIIKEDDTFGFHYGGTHFTYYRVSMALKDLSARFDTVALPPFGVDGKVQSGTAALEPTFQNFGETLYVFPPYETWFELALHWDGRRHELYVDRVLVAEAELHEDAAVLPAGPVALYQHGVVGMNIQSLAVYPPGLPPWDIEGAQ
jgi:hypothetical protein